MSTRYLNVDLELRSKHDLKRLIGCFGDQVIVLHQWKSRGYHCASLELAETMDGPDEAIIGFCMLIESLPASLRSDWDACTMRAFDIGYESGFQPSCFRSEIAEGTIRRLSASGGSMVISVYPQPMRIRRVKRTST